MSYSPFASITQAPEITTSPEITDITRARRVNSDRPPSTTLEIGLVVRQRLLTCAIRPNAL
jgi:hypothetical protein